MMKSKMFLIPLICVFIPALLFAQETLTITTYYPSPYGSYNDLAVARRLAIGDLDGDGNTDQDDMAVYPVGYNPPMGDPEPGDNQPIQGSLVVERGIGIGTRNIATSSGGGSDYIIRLKINEGVTNRTGLLLGRSDANWNLGLVSNLGAGGYNPISSAGDVGIIFGNGTINTTTDLVIAPWRNTAATGIKILGDNGNVGINTNNPQSALDVNGTVRMTGFRMPTDADDGRVLTSDANGNGTWEEPPDVLGSNDCYWLDIGNGQGPGTWEGTCNNGYYVRGEKTFIDNDDWIPHQRWLKCCKF